MGKKGKKKFRILDPTWTIYTIKIQGKQGTVGTNVEVPTSDWLGSTQIKYIYLVSGQVYHVPHPYDMFLVFWLWCIEAVLLAAARGWLGWWRHTKVGAGPVPLSCLTSRSRQQRDQALWRRNLEMMGKVARCPGSSTSVRWHHHHYLYTTVTSLIP